MLILTRYAGQSILVNEDIIVKVVEVRPDGRVRLGVEAPQEVSIMRAELTGWVDPQALADRHEPPTSELDQAIRDIQATNIPMHKRK